MSSSPDVVVVGGGPSGAAAAYWLAEAGHSVALIEKKEYPREKTCGDGLTPRAIHELQLMGFDFEVPELHRINGLRSYGAGSMIEMEWPDHPVYPKWGAIIRRALRSFDDYTKKPATFRAARGALLSALADASGPSRT